MAKVTAPNNMDIWNALGRTDPAHTKQFTRAGGFKGTAIKPMWANLRMTEYFGPCGVGWGMDKPEFQLVPVDGEIMVYCTLNMWYKTAMDHTGNVYGIGGDKVVARGKDGFRTDDEAFKKAYTDALSNAMKFIGVAADVHMGQFDDNKYVNEVAAEFDAAKKKEVEEEVERQKKAPGFNPNPDADVMPPELDWSYQRSSGVLICRPLDVKEAKNKNGKSFIVVKLNQKIDNTDEVFYFHDSHRAELIAGKGKICKLMLTTSKKGYLYIDLVLEVDGKKMTKDEPVENSTKDFSDDETQARLLASTLDLQEEELRELHALNKHNWAFVIGVLKTEQERRRDILE